MQDILVELEFLDVFLAGLLGLPLSRDMEFEIELVLISALISKAPYCTALVELKELKTQLQEF